MYIYVQQRKGQPHQSLKLDIKSIIFSINKFILLVNDKFLQSVVINLQSYKKNMHKTFNLNMYKTMNACVIY